MNIPVPFLNNPLGLGDAVKAATEAVGVKPCGGCKQRQAAANRAVRFVPWKLALPAGYRLVMQGQRDREVQVLLAQSPHGWSTFESRDGQVSGEQPFAAETEARASYAQRMIA